MTIEHKDVVAGSRKYLTDKNYRLEEQPGEYILCFSCLYSLTWKPAIGCQQKHESGLEICAESIWQTYHAFILEQIF